MLAYDAKTKSVRVIPLDMVPLENVEKEMAINLDEKPLNIFSIPSTVCGVAVAPGRTGTWTVTTAFSAVAVLYTQVIMRGDSVSTHGTSHSCVVE